MVVHPVMARFVQCDQVRHGVGLLTRPAEPFRFGLADDVVHMRCDLPPTATLRTLAQPEIATHDFLAANPPRSVVAAFVPREFMVPGLLHASSPSASSSLPTTSPDIVRPGDVVRLFEIPNDRMSCATRLCSVSVIENRGLMTSFPK